MQLWPQGTCVSVNVYQKFLTWLEWQNYYEVHEGAVELTEDGDDWMIGCQMAMSCRAASVSVYR